MMEVWILRFVQLFKSLLALTFLVGCSSTAFNVRTAPDKAQVWVRSFGSGNFELVGETPLTIPLEKMPGQPGHSGPVEIEIRRSGYQTEKILVTEISKVDLEINYALRSSTGLENHEALNGVIDALFSAQRLAKVGRYDEAIKTLSDIQRKAPNIAAVYELMGGIYLLQKRFDAAFDAYSLAVKNNPANVESVRLRNALGNSLGREPVENLPLPEPARAPATNQDQPMKEGENAPQNP